MTEMSMEETWVEPNTEEMEQPMPETDAFLAGFDGEEDDFTAEAVKDDSEGFDDLPDLEQTEEPEDDLEQGELFVLKHLGEEKQVTLPEMQVLAQKGLDYDRIREKYDGSKEVMTLLHHLANRNGLTTEDYLRGLATGDKTAGMRHQADQLMQNGVLNEAMALGMIQTEQGKENMARQEAVMAQQKMTSDLEQLVRLRPELVEKKSLPAEVLQRICLGGMTPTMAYLDWENQQNQRMLTNYQLAERNWEKNLGSLKGDAVGEADPFLSGFEQG